MGSANPGADTCKTASDPRSALWNSLDRPGWSSTHGGSLFCTPISSTSRAVTIINSEHILRSSGERIHPCNMPTNVFKTIVGKELHIRNIWNSFIFHYSIFFANIKKSELSQLQCYMPLIQALGRQTGAVGQCLHPVNCILIKQEV